MIRKVASILGPVTLSHLISERCWYMNKKIQPEVVKKIQPEVEATSAKPQAASDTTCGCVDNFKKDLTAGVG